MGRTLFQKIWDEHVVEDLGEEMALLHVDRHFLHELSGAISLKAIDEAGRRVRDPTLTFGVVDHAIDTHPGRGRTSAMPGGQSFLDEFAARVRAHDICFFDYDDDRQGIVHVVAPELGIALPGTIFVCGDSHTCTIGALGALAWGIGSSDSEHVLATQAILATKPRELRVSCHGALGKGVYAKDLALHLLGHLPGAALDHVVEFTGSAIARLSMAGRLTLANMAVEWGAFTALIAPDEVTFQYLEDRPFAPTEPSWSQALDHWRSLVSDVDSHPHVELAVDCMGLAPQVSWGTNSRHVVAIDALVPNPEELPDPVARAAAERALGYMGLHAGEAVAGLQIHNAFIGSCTNSRLEDLREAANILRGNRVAAGVLAICSPGSTAVKHAAEREGLDVVFREAGFQWREAGCSLCASGALGGESFAPGSRAISTTNRNFENRQGRAVRTHLASPATVAASALAGCIVDARSLS